MASAILWDVTYSKRPREAGQLDPFEGLRYSRKRQMTDLKNAFIDHLLKRHPGLKDQPRAYYEEKVADNLLSPFEVRLPKKLREDMTGAVRAFSELRDSLDRGTNGPGNRAIMMSYDFHIDENGDLKLIEINTNAAFLILSHEMYLSRGIPSPAGYDEKRFGADIREELALWSEKSGRPAAEKPLVAIIDEKPDEQRLFIEFLVAREWLNSLGWKASIRDVSRALEEPRPDFVYNRSTDFAFSHPVSAPLRRAFDENSLCFSPNPHEYALLADKQRLIEWTRPGYLDAAPISREARDRLKAVLPLSHDVAELGPDELWARRKKLFFKPKREFGSKKAFKGASISKKTFDELLLEDPIAQEYVHAPERVFETPAGPQSFKFDLRCYAYGDRFESVVARLYQGQVTNLKTPYGGFTPVVFE